MSGVVGVGDVGTLEVRLLDGVHLIVGDTEVELRGDRTRALLARLALDRGSAVSRDVLIDDVWGGAPGKSGAGALRVQVKRLRDQLVPHGLDHLVETTPDGYRLADGVVTDVDRVEAAIDDAAGERASPAELLDRFSDVAHVVRGRPLDGLEDLWFAVAATARLTRLQTRAVTWFARVCLADGRADQAESLLLTAMERSPTDEGLAATHIDALAALGRNRDALAVAHRLRSELAEVGLVPGDEILRREQEILNPSPVAPAPVATGIAGRRFEIERLLDSVDALTGGVGTTVTISGPAGIGKTVLAQLVADDAIGRGWPVVTAVADEMDRQRPFHLLHAAHVRRHEGVAEPLDLADVLVDVPDVGEPGGFDPEGARLSVATRLTALVRGLQAPVVVLAEDLHWADQSSLAVLRALSRTARQRPVLVVLTGRPETPWMQALGELPRVDIQLGPLRDDDIRRLAEDQVGGSLGPDLATAVTAAGGNPLLVVEYLRGLRLEDRLVRIGDVVDSSGTGPPTTIQGLAARRLRTLDARVIDVLDTAAVIGRVSDGRDLARICHVGVRDLAGLLEPAERSGIVAHDGTRVTFLHDLFRDAVYAGVADARRATLHREVAELFAATDRPVISVAAHALLSGPERDSQTIAWMREAAAAAVAVEPNSSIAFLDRALELTSGVDERFRLQHAKVEALTTAGELKAATELVDVLVRARRPETAVLQVRYAGLLMAQAKANEARQVLAHVDPAAVTDDLRARWGALTALCSYAAFDQSAAREHAERAIADGTGAGDAIGLSMAHGVVGRCDVMSHRYRDGLAAGRLSAEYADADPTGGAHLYLPWYFVGMTRLDLDEHDGVEDALERGRAVSERHHLHFSWPLYLTLETALAQRTGDLDRAFRAGVEALEIEQQVGDTLVSAWLRALLSLTALEAGDVELAETYCVEAERAQAAGSPQGAHIVALARAELHREAGDLRAAYEGLEENWRFFDAFSLHACKPWIAPALARAAAHVGDATTIAAVRQEMDVLVTRSDAAAHVATCRWVEGLIAHEPASIAAARDGFAALGRHRDASLAMGDEVAVR